jgi:hypothetical protein
MEHLTLLHIPKMWFTAYLLLTVVRIYIEEKPLLNSYRCIFRFNDPFKYSIYISLYTTISPILVGSDAILKQRMLILQMNIVMKQHVTLWIKVQEGRIKSWPYKNFIPHINSNYSSILELFSLRTELLNIILS